MVTLSLSVWLGYKIDYHWLAWKLPVFTALFPILTLIFLLYKIIIEFNKHTGKK